MDPDALTDADLAVLDAAVRAEATAVRDPSEAAALRAEADLFTALRLVWAGLAAKAVRAAASAVEAGVPARDALALARRLMGRMEADAAPDVWTATGAAYRAGYAAALVEMRPASTGLVLALGEIDERALAWLHRHHVYWVGTYYDRALSDRVAAAVAEAMGQGMGRREAGRALARAMEGVVGAPGRTPRAVAAYWRGLAGVVTTRSQELGRLSGYEASGLAWCRLSAARDARTSDVCRRLDGKRVAVADLVALRGQMMQARTPEAVKALAGWGDGASVPADAERVTDPRYLLPPFHMHCRTRLVPDRP